MAGGQSSLIFTVTTVCEVISRARAGDIWEAEEHLRQLKHLAKDDEAFAFVHAAQGLIAFCRNDPEEGERSYKLAIESARKAKRPDLVVTAAMFYAEMATEHVAIPAEEIVEFCTHLEKLINQRFPNNKDEVQRLWKARRQNIEMFTLQGFLTENREVAPPNYNLPQLDASDLLLEPEI